MDRVYVDGSQEVGDFEPQITGVSGTVYVSASQVGVFSFNQAGGVYVGSAEVGSYEGIHVGYSTLAEVKRILRKAVSDTPQDTEISSCIGDADVDIDNELQNYESSLPLATVPDAINRVSKYLAASLFLGLYPSSQIDKDRSETYSKLAVNLLSKYIEEKYQQPVLVSA